MVTDQIVSLSLLIDGPGPYCSRTWTEDFLLHFSLQNNITPRDLVTTLSDAFKKVTQFLKET